jgi:hypothetical protein
MMKKTHHNTGIGITVLLMVGGMFIIFTSIEVYGQFYAPGIGLIQDEAIKLVKYVPDTP